MADLILVRHGQASFMAENYDKLSSLGAEQARALGKFWAGEERQFDRVLAGPLSRQQDTEKHLRHSYTATGQALPEAELVAGLREHEANEAFVTSLPKLAEQNNEYGLVARKAISAEGSKRDQLRAFGMFVGPWAEGRFDTEEFEPFATFQERIETCLREIMASADSGETIMAVTSGGVIATAIGLALQTPPARIMKLNGVVYNGSYHQFRFRTHRQDPDFSLYQFNAIPHLPPHLQSQI